MSENMKRKGIVIFVLGLLSAIGPFSIDMYLPSFGDIADTLHTNVDQVGFSLASFFAGISIGQLIYGPLLDKYGRKPLIYIGLIIYIITSILCALVFNVEQLIIMRFLQALGSCVGMVASRALVRDLFPVHETAKVFSYLMLVIAISPILAPTFGGFLSIHFGWQAIFIILAVLGALTLLGTYFVLPKGIEPDREMSLKPKPIVLKFIKVSKVPKFYIFALVSAISSSGLYAYLAASPVLFQQIFKVSKKEYAVIFAIIALGMTLANQTNVFLLKRYSSEKISMVALLFQIAAGLVLTITTYFGLLNLYTTIGAIWFFMATQGYVYPNTSALSIAPFTKSAGTASALMGAVQLGIGALTTAIVSATTKTSAFPMAMTILVCGSLSTIIFFIGRKAIRKGKYEDEESLTKTYSA